MSKLDPPNEGGLLEEAAAWFARMRGPDAEASRADFEAWLARGALHRAAYNRASEIFAMGKFLADEDDVATASIPAARSRLRPILFAAGAAVLLIVVTASWLILRTISLDQSGRSTSQHSSTAIQIAQLTARNEPQSIRLADGSLVKLEAGTSIAVGFSRALRRLTLERGTARFFVAHELRPFLVYAGGGIVAAHGTIFDVGLAGKDQVVVRLIEGTIDVTPAAAARRGAANAAPRRLHAGESMRFTAVPESALNHAAPSAAAVGAALSPSVPQARDFDSVPLAELVRQANEGASRPILLADPALGQLRISGKFRIDDTDLLAARIAALFDLAADGRNPAEIVIRPK